MRKGVEMRVACIASKGTKELSSTTCSSYSNATAEELEIGRQYIVYGQCLFKDCLEYLIDPGGKPGWRKPNWYPSVWFQLVEGAIPSSWIFSFKNEPASYEPRAIWGYHELVTNPNHLIDLIERTDDALEIFVQRAGAIDREHGSD